MKVHIQTLLCLVLLVHIENSTILLKSTKDLNVHKDRRLDDDVVVLQNKNFINTIKGFKQTLDRVSSQLSSAKRDAFDNLDRAIGRLDLGGSQDNTLEDAMEDTMEGSYEESGSGEERRHRRHRRRHRRHRRHRH